MNDRREFYFETIYVFMCTINPIISDEGSNAKIDHFCIKAVFLDLPTMVSLK